MKKLFLISLLLSLTLNGIAQSRSVERFRSDNRPSTKLFFYKSTLKMISRIDLAALGGAGVSEFQDMPPIGDMIKGIEKVKFFLYENTGNTDYVENADFKKLQASVKGEGYESMMSARIEGNDMNIMMKERRGKPVGFVVLITMETGFSIIDIEGYPDLKHIMKFSTFMNSNGSSMGLSEAFR